MLDPEAGDQVLCEGCGTSHHAACIAELGRCTVLGCEQPLIALALPQRDLANESQRSRLLRRRIRERVRQFVRDHTKPPDAFGKIHPRDRLAPRQIEEPQDPAPRTFKNAARELGTVMVLVLGIPVLLLVLYALLA